LTSGSSAKEDLDRSPLIHRPVSLGGLLEQQFEVEDLSRVDIDRSRRYRPRRSSPGRPARRWRRTSRCRAGRS
jgi:hypothetical protein